VDRSRRSSLRRRDESNKQTRGREKAKKEEGCCPWSGRSGSYSGAAAACWLNRNSAAYNPHYPPDLKFRDNGISQTRPARRRRPSPTQCSDIQADTVLPDMKWIISTRPFSVLLRGLARDESTLWILNHRLAGKDFPAEILRVESHRLGKHFLLPPSLRPSAPIVPHQRIGRTSTTSRGISRVLIASLRCKINRRERENKRSALSSSPRQRRDRATALSLFMWRR